MNKIVIWMFLVCSILATVGCGAGGFRFIFQNLTSDQKWNITMGVILSIIPVILVAVATWIMSPSCP
jgi:heme/copper-type cytochrome/quinol oxidase subunit 4